MDKILIINHKERHCGIHQYGEDIYTTLKKSRKYEFHYAECSSEQEFRRTFFRPPYPKAVIYNYYPATMPWLTWDITRDYSVSSIKAKHMGIMHEVTQEDADQANQALFDYWLCPDPTLVPNEVYLKTKRLIPEYLARKVLPEVTTIGSFGFGFADKGFERIVTTVQNEFDEANIRFLMPKNGLVESEHPEYNTQKTAKRCFALVKKPGIRLSIIHDFLERNEVLDFLSGNTINCFFYNVNKKRGISSVLDSALAADRPIALTKCGMFRHMFDADPSIFIEDRTLKEIIVDGRRSVMKYLPMWSEKAFVEDYERILDGIL